MRQQSLWADPEELARAELWDGLPETARAELVNQLVRIVVDSALMTGQTQKRGDEDGEQDPVDTPRA